MGATATVGKKELAAALKWSRPTLDKRLKVDPKFPVKSRGDQSGGWQFIVADVRAYLGNARPLDSPSQRQSLHGMSAAPSTFARQQHAGRHDGTPAAPLPPIDQAQLRDAVAPPLPVVEKYTPKPRASAHHSGEATARQRKDEADASLKENKLRAENGELVVRSELQQAISTLVLSFAHDLDALPEKIAKALELRDDAIPGIRTMIDKIRSDMADRAQQLLA